MGAADIIRRQVVEVFAPDVEFTARDVSNSVDRGADGRNVGNALSSWCDRNMIVKGMRLERIGTQTSGLTRRYKLRPANDSSPNTLTFDFGAEAAKFTEKAKGQVIGGRTATFQIMDVKADGSALVRSESGALYILRKLDW
jgi:hypothetical protein